MYNYACQKAWLMIIHVWSDKDSRFKHDVVFYSKDLGEGTSKVSKLSVFPSSTPNVKKFDVVAALAAWQA